jgi:hypothetical protein
VRFFRSTFGPWPFSHTAARLTAGEVRAPSGPALRACRTARRYLLSRRQSKHQTALNHSVVTGLSVLAQPCRYAKAGNSARAQQASCL